ncbi:site-specific integrase [Chloroflexales bacterium ZM16-3]|nr:site-specific integrase [Chloroflexales bacterium ZM16-3]
MPPLRQRMTEDMQLRGFSPDTQRAYLQAVTQLAPYVRKSPDQVTEEELRQYFLYLHNEKRVARLTATVALCAIKFFFEHTLRQSWPRLELLRPRPVHKLPVVLSVDEVWQILAQAHPSPPGLAVPCAAPRRPPYRCRDPLRPDGALRLSRRPGRLGQSEGGLRPHLAPLLGHPSARSRRQPAPDPGLARPSLADQHRDLHPPHPEGRTAGHHRPRYLDGRHAVVNLGEVARRYGPQLLAQ